MRFSIFVVYMQIKTLAVLCVRTFVFFDVRTDLAKFGVEIRYDPGTRHVYRKVTQLCLVISTTDYIVTHGFASCLHILIFCLPSPFFSRLVHKNA